MLNNAKQALGDQFKALAGEILAKNADTVSKQQQERLGAVLDPLRERLSEFSKMVKTSYDHENRERISLQEQLKNLVSINTRLSDDAESFGKGFDPAVKNARGDWGEQMLEKLLQHAGLRRDYEYRVQVTGTNDDAPVCSPTLLLICLITNTWSWTQN